jgi:hypothetical protein
MLKIDKSAQPVLRECVSFLSSVGSQDPSLARRLRDSLRKSLLFMHQYSCHKDGGGWDLGKHTCVLYKDWAPLSFRFVMDPPKKQGERHWFSGGCIFHGDHDGGGDGGAPTFSVCLTAVEGWSIHT